MLSNPKWLLFFVLFFSIMHILGAMMNGIWALNETSVSTVDAIKQTITFNYAWISGDLKVVAIILNIIEGIVIALISYELLAGLWSGIRR